ncbi:unnamed protein product, partial [Didymodactylos carnosus]
MSTTREQQQYDDQSSQRNIQQPLDRHLSQAKNEHSNGTNVNAGIDSTCHGNKAVHPDTGISSKAMSIMNSFVNDIFERIAAESSRVLHYNKRSTISAREIQTAVRLLLPGEL